MSDFENQKNKGLPSSASPKARKFARELGVNINLVLGSQRDGRVVEEDIKKFVKHVGQEKNTQSKNEFKTEFTHSDFGEIEIIQEPMPEGIELGPNWLNNSMYLIKDNALTKIE